MSSTTRKLTGKAGSLTFNGVAIPFTKYSYKATRDLADTTDSSNYDPTTDLVHKAQVPHSIQGEISVEGIFDLNSTNTAIIQQLYSGATAVPVVLALNSGTTLGHGTADLSDFSADVPIEDKVSWTATLKTNGIFTTGA